MKWTSRGHQYDDTYAEIMQKKEFYLFGAGDYGKLFLSAIKNEISILGFIDNDSRKQKEGYAGYPVYPPAVLTSLRKDQGVILTISQFARASAAAQLKKMGLCGRKDYFLFEEFLSVYFVYQYQKVYMSSISFLPGTVCNLKCRHCLNFNPFAKKYYMRGYEDLTKDLDSFFDKVDRVMIFHLSGGEPMLMPDIGRLIRYIDVHYGNRIDIFRTVTNGTVVPSEDTLRALAESNIEVTVDDYRDAVPQYADTFPKVLEAFERHGVRYVINKAEEWVDLAPEKTDFSGESEEFLIKHFDNCCQTWHELRDGRLYMCNYASYAQVAGLVRESPEESYDLSGDLRDKKELVEFRLGYSDKGYTSFCKKCRGFMETTETVPPARQVE